MKAIHDAIIEAYGANNLKAIRERTGSGFSKTVLLALRRDYPNVARSFKWGGFTHVMNHLNSALNETN